MTTETMQACPVCEYRYTLMAGFLPLHSNRGDACPGGGLSLKDAQAVADQRQEVRASLSAPASGVDNAIKPPLLQDDAQESKKRKPGSDRRMGARRGSRIPMPPQVSIPSAVGEPMLQDDVQVLGPSPAPKDKRRPHRFIVAVVYELYDDKAIAVQVVR